MIKKTDSFLNYEMQSNIKDLDWQEFEERMTTKNRKPFIYTTTI